MEVNRDKVVCHLIPSSSHSNNAKVRDFSELLKDKKILVVDDNEVNRMFLEELMLQVDVDVTAVNSGEEAIQELLRVHKSNLKPYDIALIDWQMPTLDGLETVCRIYEEEGISLPPNIIMVTAYDKDELKKQVDAGYIQAILEKPITPNTLYDAFYSIMPVKQLAYGKGDTPIFRGFSLEAMQVQLDLPYTVFIPILVDFINELPGMVALIEEKIKSEDFTTAQLKAHTIKGTAGNLGIEKLSAMASEIDRASKSKAVPILQEKLPAFRRHIEELFADNPALVAYLHFLQNTQKSGESTLPLEALGQLKDQLENANMSAGELVSKLLTQLPSALQADMRKIAQSIEELDFDQALVQLHTFTQQNI